MTGKNPGMTKRGSRAESGETEREEGSAAREASPSESPAQAAEEGADPVDGDGGVPPGQTAGDGEGRQDGAAWTEKSIERLLATVDAVSADAAETRSMVERLAVAGGRDAAAGAEERVRVQGEDFHRWIETDRLRRRRWTAVAVAAAAPAALLLGLLLQQQFEVIPLHDPTKGWGGHIWEMYGRTIVDCALEAMRTDSEVHCPLAVRRP